ncbi:MAG: PEP-CTERM sorting domain-containing protein [Nostoc sp.]
MNKQISTNALIIFVSLLGVCSSITPASAIDLNSLTKTVTKTPVTPVVESASKTLVTPVVESASKTPVTPVVESASKTPVTPVVESASKTPVTPVVESASKTPVTPVVESASKTPVTPVVESASKTPVTPVVESASKTTGNVEVGKNVTALVQETTNTTVGQVAGASTDSITTAKVDPSQIKLPSLDNPTEFVKITGEAALGIQSNQQSTQADAQANLGVGIGDFATVGICLDANATLGILNQGSSANCPKDVKTPPAPVKTPPIVIEPPYVPNIPSVVDETPYVPIKIPHVTPEKNCVPEPTTLGGLALLGVYFISRRRQISQFKT